MIFRVNFGFHGISFGAPAPVIRLCGDGFGPLYNAACPPKQAKDPGRFASGGGWAYLGVANRMVEIS
jgi:hypothetical protein